MNADNTLLSQSAAYLVVVMVTMHWAMQIKINFQPCSDICCLEVAPFHAAGQKARLWLAGQAYRCTGSSSVSPSDNLVATEAGVCLVIGLLIV